MLRALYLIELAAFAYGAGRSLSQSQFGGSIQSGGIASGEGEGSGIISFVPAPTPFQFCQLSLSLPNFLFPSQSSDTQAQAQAPSNPCFNGKPQINNMRPTIVDPIPSATSFQPQNVALVTSSNLANVKQELEANKMKWQQSNVKYYSYQIRQIFQSPRKIEVGVCEENYSNVPQEYAQYNNIDKIFTFVESELSQNPHNATLKYDPLFGFITYVLIDKFQFAADDQFGLEISDFTLQGTQNCVV